MVKNTSHVSLERIPRSRILIIFICANLLFLVLGLIVGKNMSTAQSEALASSQEKLTVTTKNRETSDRAGNGTSRESAAG